MEWQQLIGFLHVARLGSFTEAARSTGRTQSALSQQIRALEREFGCRLLIRGDVVKPTSEGFVLLEFANDVMARKGRLDNEISDFKKLIKGSLSIAASFSSIYHLFPARVKAYRDLHPGVELSLRDRPHNEIGRLVLRGECDLGVAPERSLPDQLTKIRWRELGFYLVVPETHPFAALDAIPLELLFGQPLIVPLADSDFWRVGEVMRRLKDECEKIEIALRSSNVELNAIYVKAGVGLAFATVAKEEKLNIIDGIKLVPIAGEFAGGWLSLAFRPEGADCPAISSMVDLLTGHRQV